MTLYNFLAPADRPFELTSRATPTSARKGLILRNTCPFHRVALTGSFAVAAVQEMAATPFAFAPITLREPALTPRSPEQALLRGYSASCGSREGIAMRLPVGLLDPAAGGHVFCCPWADGVGWEVGSLAQAHSSAPRPSQGTTRPIAPSLCYCECVCGICSLLQNPSPLRLPLISRR